MRKNFRFANKDYALEVQNSVEAEGDFRKCPGLLSYDGKQRQGFFKLTQPAWDLAGRLAQQQSRPIEEILAEGGIAALKAEL